jgi:hypothetical protein
MSPRFPAAFPSNILDPPFRLSHSRQCDLMSHLDLPVPADPRGEFVCSGLVWGQVGDRVDGLGAPPALPAGARGDRVRRVIWTACFACGKAIPAAMVTTLSVRISRRPCAVAVRDADRGLRRAPTVHTQRDGDLVGQVSDPLNHPNQHPAQARGQHHRIRELHPTHLVSNGSDRRGCRLRHGSLPMIKAGVRTAMITTRVVPAPAPTAACRRSSTPIHRDVADPPYPRLRRLVQQPPPAQLPRPQHPR